MNDRKLARILAKLLHQHGEPLDDGRLALDVDAAVAALASLGVLRAPGRSEGDDGDEGDDAAYDAAAEGRAMAARQKGEAAATKGLASR
jgi:hypothetical protein